MRVSGTNINSVLLPQADCESNVIKYKRELNVCLEQVKDYFSSS